MKRTTCQKVFRQSAIGIAVAISTLMGLSFAGAQTAEKASPRKSAVKKTATNSTLKKRGSQLVAQNSTPVPSSGTSAQVSAQVPVKPVQEQKRTSLRWRISTDARQWENSNERVLSAGFGITFDFSHIVNENLLFKAVTGASMRSGYVHTRFGEMSARNSIWISDGYVQGSLGSVLKLRGGIINQGVWNASQVNDGVPFPGLLEIIRFGDEYFVQLMAGQSVPIAHEDLSTRTTGTEPTPTFMAESITIGLQPQNAWLGLSLFGGHWAYHNLPRSTARDSDVGGNTLVEVDGWDRQFKYRFEGWFAGASGQLNFSKRSYLSAHIEVSQNTQAPEAFGAAQVAGLTLTFGLPKNVDVTSGVDFFFSESDASPAYYNSTFYGHNNRQGYAVNLAANFRDLGFRIGGMFTDADVINPNPLQERQQLYMIKFETNYAAL